MLPTHLIPNEQLLKMDKQHFFGLGLDKGIYSEKFNLVLNRNISNDLDSATNYSSTNFSNNRIISNITSNNSLNDMLEKYNNYFKILKEDLEKNLEKNKLYSQEISDIEEERNYYMSKLENVLKLCESALIDDNISNESCDMVEYIMKIITHIPEDFK